MINYVSHVINNAEKSGAKFLLKIQNKYDMNLTT